jgi:uncharacterized protein YfaT (DUF1175 family)
MSEVEELEAKVQSLAAEDFAKFRDWFIDFADRRLRANDLQASFGLLKARKSASLEDFEAAIAGTDSDDD